MQAFDIAVNFGGHTAFQAVWEEPLEIGRQRQGEPKPFTIVTADDTARLIVAALSEVHTSRRQLRVEMLANKALQIANLSTNRPVELENGRLLEPGDVVDLPLPVRIAFSGRTIDFSEPDASMEVHSLDHEALPPGGDPRNFTMLMEAVPVSEQTSHGRLIEWLSSAMHVLQSAATSPDFLDHATQAVREIVELSMVAVLMYEGGKWNIRAQWPLSKDESEEDWFPSHTILEQVRSRKRTVRHLPQSRGAPESLLGVQALVAAPILDRAGNVVGALYGDRRLSQNKQPTISEIEAILVELLASGVAAGLARVEQERAAMEARIQFEQYFTPTLARQLERNPNLLEGRAADVSILFCDVRGFSRISEKIGPAKTMEWIGDIMGELSECVLAEEGVLADYIGDELMAMWGAPEEQPDHAVRATRAGLAMLRQVPVLQERWQQKIDEPFAVGIGICSGPAQVGNTGSKRKFKYGPLGTTVNLASRIQGATKYLQTPLLVGGSTAAKLDPTFKKRRLSQVQVVNVKDPVALYEVLDDDAPVTVKALTEFEEGLRAFEESDLPAAKAAIDDFLQACPNDPPALVLLERIEQAMQGGKGFDPSVWRLPGK